MTYDQNTGEVVDTTRDYPMCRDKSAPLPPPIPRSLRTVFHFTRTNAAIPPDALLSTGPENASFCADPLGTVAETSKVTAPAPQRDRLVSSRQRSYAEAFARLPLE